ncbi:hypothetical protein [Streptomyces sp. NPDC053560]|uniref:hypothetical protein n=1 Tax=Streptomyces sp. NPDC053560 TaxID=3365711 RepID=UPI0037CD7701
MADAAYGLWPLVVFNTLLFVVFAASFFHPKTRRDWRAMSACTARTPAFWPRRLRAAPTHRRPDIPGAHSSYPPAGHR